MKYRLGIDLGSSSLGWCVLKLDENNQPCELLKLGVRIFPDGRDAKSHQPTSVNRREKRSQRRRRDRFIERRNRLLKLLIKTGLMPRERQARKEIEKLNPYQYRAEAAVSQVSLFQLGRALFHINQRRGFKSNRLVDSDLDAELSGMKKSIKDLQVKLDGQTLGQYLHDRLEQGKNARLRPQTVRGKNEWDFYVSRQMIEEEVRQILNTQTRYYPELLNNDLKQELIDTIVDQRPLKPQEPGWCTLIEGERRGHLARTELQQFRIEQEVSNLELKQYHLVDPQLNQDQRQKIRDELTRNFSKVNKDGLLTWAKLRDLLGLNQASEFNLDTLGRKGLWCNLTAFKLSQKDAFGKNWWTFDPVNQWRIISGVLSRRSALKPIKQH